MKWFWIITLQWSTGHGQRTSTVSGGFAADQVAALGSRSAAFQVVKANALAALGAEDGPVNVLFFSLEPDDLASAP